MKKQSYSEFVIKQAEHLKDLSAQPWWTFEQQGSSWLVKGFCSADNSKYSLLLSNYSRAYFACAGTTQILREIQEYNPMIQGGVAGVLPLLFECIGKFNEGTQYAVHKPTRSFEVETVVKGLFQFKWVISLEKLPRSVSKKVLQRFLVMPLVNVCLAQDASLKNLEEASKKKAEIDLRVAENQNFGLMQNCSAKDLAAGSFLAAVRAEEVKIPKNVTKAEAPGLKRKPSPPKPVEKQLKLSEDYTESAEELKRKLEIQARLGKKKEKKKLDFL